MSVWNNFKGLMPSCREAARVQSEALDHPLPPTRRFGLWLHLLICKWCRRYGKQIRFMRESAHTQQANLIEAGPERLSEETRERMKRRLRDGK